MILKEVDELIKKLEWLVANCGTLPLYKRAELAEVLKLARSLPKRLENV